MKLHGEPSDSGGERDHLKTATGLAAWLEWPQVERTYFCGIGEHTFSLYAGPDLAFHFDPEGRLRRSYVEGKHYLRGLDGHLLRKTFRRRSDVPPPGEASLTSDEALTLYALVEETVARARRELESGPVPAAGEADGSAIDQVTAALDRAARWTPGRLVAEAERFRLVYEPIGVLPPDCYRSLILQVTTGCRYGHCTFCTLYRGVAHHQKTPAEFRAHVGKVRELLGNALSLKRGVFLGEANALEIASSDLEQIFEVVREELPDLVDGQAGRGRISAFTDTFEGRWHDARMLGRFRSLGLGRVYLGVESGDDGVLRALRKPTSTLQVRARVGALHGAGVRVGVIFLIGAGGRAAGRAHVEATVELVRELRLGSEDVVYLSPLYLGGGEDSVPGGPATAEDLAREERELFARLRALGLHVSRYDLRNFIYY